MDIHQFATSLTYGDAISNEMLEIRKVLRENGFGSDIFVRFFDPRMGSEGRDYRDYPRFSDPRNAVIFHFSIGSPVSKMFFRIPDRKIMIYHNITPYSYFIDTHRILTRECYKGRLELQLFKDKVDLALGDSEYNRRELEAAGYPRTGVLPLLIDFEKFTQAADPVFSRIVNSGKTTLLFVGRVIPNKGFEDVIKTFYFYKKYFNPRSQLYLVGDYRGMERYFAALMELTGRLKLDDVYFTGRVEFSELVACFAAADVYLSMSEHEGFGVPLLEAFFRQVPVIAFAAGAVEETMNGGGVLLRRKDFSRTAALIDRVVRDNAFKRQIQETQNQALQKYRLENTGRILLEQVERAASA
jgi:L-malate glycosyltransferase